MNSSFQEGVRDAARFNIVDGSVDGKEYKMRALNSKDRNRYVYMYLLFVHLPVCTMHALHRYVLT
jgi:hypothetical protein